MEAERLKTILLDLEQTLLEFIRKHKINHEEYRVATRILEETIEAGEKSLLPDVFFEAETTAMGNLQRQGSGEAIEGPFFFPGAPRLGRPAKLPQRPDEEGDILFFNGRVTTAEGTPLADAEIDVWQADAEGLYSKIVPGIPEWNLRGRLLTDADGRFEVQTILPPPYEIPKNGPTGRVLTAMGRHFFRPAHLHVKVRDGERGEMTSQLYFHGDKYLTSDVANAVRDDLIVQLRHHDQPDDLKVRGLRAPYYEATYDFVL